MISKVVIAAAGEGTRMLHLTANKSKHLIKVKKRPFLAYLLDNLFSAGYRDLILVVGYKEELIRSFLNRYKPPLKSLRPSQYKIRMVSQYEILGPKAKIYGTACPLMCVKDIIKKSQFIYLCGDNLYSIRDLEEMNNSGKYSYVAGLYKKNPEKYGVLVQEEEFLKEVIEKPKQFFGNLVNTGLYKFTPEVFDKLKKIKKSPRGEYEITDVINLLAKRKKVKIKAIKDFWMDFGNPADIIVLSYFLSSFRKFKKLFWLNRNFNIIPSRSKEAVKIAIEHLERGQVLVCPTDTVYGLLADATNDKAVERVFDIKKRDRKKAVPVFVKDIAMAKKYAIMDKEMEKFLEEIWPGKITVALIKKEKSGLSKIVSDKKTTVGLRIPNYKLVNEILDKFNKPLIGTSANISGKPSTTKIAEIYKYFEDQEIRPDLILNAGDLAHSAPSTVVDFSQDKPKIIRRGR
ncbi:MAG: L-threonylcarbamoyladenylate synthase [bacterium]|nr:L-threonylcarbamoyladenylate synthase [bacterium]